MQICETDNKALYQPSMMQGINTLIQSVIHLPFNKLFLGVFMPEVSHVYATFFSRGHMTTLAAFTGDKQLG